MNKNLAIFCTLSAWDEFNQYSIADELRKRVLNWL